MKTRVKYLLAVVFVGVLVAAGALTLWISSDRRSVENWVGQQLLGVANRYLEPQLSFAEIRYHYPRTVVLTDVRLTAEDPRAEGGHVEILVVNTLTLELAEIPRRGQPIRIRRLELEIPKLRLVAEAAARPGTGGGGNGGKGGGYLGFSHLLRREQGGAGTGSELRLSDVFDIDLIRVTEGHIIYDPGVPGQSPMELDQIDTQLDVRPTTAGGEAGWYALDFNLERKPVFESRIRGRFNLDTVQLELEALHVAMTLGREQDHYLPPHLQEILRSHEVSGRMTIDARGGIPLRQWRQAKLNARVHLEGAQVALGERRWPVAALDADLSMDQGRGTLSSLTTAVLGGRVQGSGEVNWDGADGAGRGSIDLDLEHLRLEQTLRSGGGAGGAEEGEREYRGDLSGKIRWQGTLAEPLRTGTGGGTFAIAQGRLERAPLLGPLLDALRTVMRVVGGGGSDSDTAGGDFSFQGDRVNFRRLEMSTSWAVLRGEGDMYWDRRVDLRFNGGPLEKGEAMMGDLGRAFGKATDQVAVYEVTGTLDHPEVNLKIAPALRFP